MRWLWLCLIVLWVPLITGCQSTVYSRNMRAATVSAVGTVGVKALLDEVDIEKYEPTKAEAIKVCTEVKAFLKTGKISELPLDGAKAKIQAFMEQKGWGTYIPAVLGILDLVESQKVPIGTLLGSDNIAIVEIGLDSMISSAQTSKLAWRRPATVPDLAPNAVKVYRKRE